MSVGEEFIQRGHQKRKSRLWQDALEEYTRALACAPTHPEALIGRALCLEELGDRNGALQVLESCLEAHPDQAFAHHRRGWLKYQQGDHAAALVSYKRATDLAPSWHEPAWHAAVCCHQLRDYGQAVQYYRRALRSNPDLAVVWYHYAKSLKDDGRFPEAAHAYDKARTLAPNTPDIEYSFGLFNLLQGNWETGWRGYAYRWWGSDRARSEHRPETHLGIWNGENIPRASGIVVYSEQGIGDSIQCIRFIPYLKNIFPRIKVSVQAPLIGLVRYNLSKEIDVVPRIEEPIPEQGYSHHIAMMSLPGVFNATPNNLPSAPYLASDPVLSAAWDPLLQRRRGLKVGVAWRGGNVTHAPARDIPLHFLEPLLTLPNVNWISLQNDVREQIPDPMLDVAGRLRTFSDTAALINRLDLVISVDTAVAHLAGAMGKSVWLLNRYESEWRWMRGHVATPWYPSMRIFNQPSPNAWRAVIADVESALGNLIRP